MSTDELKDKRCRAFGDVVRMRRRQLDLTQEEVAQRARVARHSVLRWEQAKSAPDVEAAWKLADALSMTMMELFAAVQSWLTDLEETELTPQDAPQCAVCGAVCIWADDAWVCTRESCGSEWYPDHGVEYAVSR